MDSLDKAIKNIAVTFEFDSQSNLRNIGITESCEINL
jgi:hypothetical protein